MNDSLYIGTYTPAISGGNIRIEIPKQILKFWGIEDVKAYQFRIDFNPDTRRAEIAPVKKEESA